jgi:hypothetical protein
MIVCPARFLAQFSTKAAVALTMFAFDAGLAFAQSAPPQPSLGLQEQGSPPPQPPQAEPAPQGAAPAARENPGLINEMGKLFDKVLPGVKSPSETIDDINARAKEAAKDAGDALSRLTKTGAMVSGRIACPPAAGGTPDCNLGAARLCQSKGFKDGKSLATDSAQACSAKVLIPGRARKPDDCHTDTYVTSALCQ